MSLVAAAALALALAGCAQVDERSPISPLPAVEGRSGLGPGVRPMSFGPGYKSAPRWAPAGGRIAFTIDGYVMDESATSDGPQRWTTKDFGAEEVEWTGGGSLAILGRSSAQASEPGAPKPLYRATYTEGSLDVQEVSAQIRAMSVDPDAGSMTVAFEISSAETGLAVLRPGGEIERVYTSVIDGRITGISPSPDGEEAALAVRADGPGAPYNIHLFDLETGEDRRLASLGAGQQIFGVPQWTEHGIYYVAGQSGSSGSGETALYELYRVPLDPQEDRLPEPAPGVGREFVAAGTEVSPDGERLAVIGRLNPKSPVNLYILDLEAKDLSAVTTNEDMEIKTGPADLDWSPGGDSVAIVARAVPSGEPAVRGAPAQALLEDFYNVYAVPVNDREPSR